MLGMKLTRKQCCLWGCGGALVIALIMPPIAIFVITPVIAQKIMYGTEIALPNSTIYPCSNNHSWMTNSVKIHVPGPFGASLQPYETIVSTTVCLNTSNASAPKLIGAGTNCSAPNTTSVVRTLGVYKAPVMNLQAGHNVQDFAVSLTSPDAAVVTTGFLLPMTGFFSPNVSTELTIESKSIDMVASLKIAGIKIGIKVKSMKLFNQLTCSFVKVHGYRDLPDRFCHPEPTATTSEATTKKTNEATSVHRESLLGRRLADSNQGYEIQCVPGAPQKTDSLNIFA